MDDHIPLINYDVKEYSVYSNKRIIMGKGNEKKDAGQSYLPYFDSQSITMAIPAPLSGLQLVHYYTSGNPASYAGFVRLRISTINYLDYLLTTSNLTSIEEYDGKTETIYGLAGNFTEIMLSSSAWNSWNAVTPIVFISSIVLWF